MTTMSDTDGMDDAERQRSGTHGPNGDFIRTVEQAERDAEAARLRSRSMSYRAIAKELGVPVATAHAMVQRALAEIVREAGEAVVALELEKLDRAEAAVLAVMEATHYTVSNGKLIELDGVPLLDDAPVLAAAGRLVQISESRRKLTGADAATKIETTGAVRYELVGVDVDKLR